MTTTQIIILAILVIACAISIGALIYAIKEYISARKALKAYKAYMQEESKRIVVHYDIPQLPIKEHTIKVACSLGFSQRRIAKIVGLSQSTVFRIMRKHGWKKAVFNTTSREQVEQ